MTCVLRVFGTHLEIDDLLREISLVPDAVFRKGDQLSIEGAAAVHTRSLSGARIVVSDAVRLWTQIDEAVLFLRANHAEVKKLSSFPGVQHADLDFNAEVFDPPWGAIFKFSTELLSLMGSTGVSLCLSIWPKSERSLSTLDDEERELTVEGKSTSRAVD